MSDAAEAARDLEPALGYRFEDAARLDLALTHSSRAYETGSRDRHNERLEFLGDAILGFVVGERLLEAAGAGAQVGDLSRRRAELVSEAPLAARARALGLGPHIRLGKGASRTGERERDSILADALEAVVAAIYLDGGLDAARAFVLRLFEGDIAARPGALAGDAKSRLQEILQARGLPVPEYRVVAESPTPQDPRFDVEVLSEGKALARGTGRTKKAAETEAAKAALDALPG
ncbi:MAG: ribonuclease III [Acidobacteria bacterium]|nr:ribonuclease III [Acidobacteriota bacterium]